MYNIIFYRTKSDEEPVKMYMMELASRADKDSRVKLNKIQDYIQILSVTGTRAGLPFVKHLEGDIWELRPLRDRILFAGWVDGQFVLLHHFMKRTQKTPKREIDQAKRNLADFIERSKK